MNTSTDSHKNITIGHIQWLGFENTNGAFTKEGFEEIQFYNDHFWYCEEGSHKKLVTNKDLDDIVIPILNAEIQKRNKERAKKMRLIHP